MDNLVKYGLVVFVLCVLINLSYSESDDASSTQPPPPSKSDRAGRKLYDAELYTGTDPENSPFASENGFQIIPRPSTGKKYVIPYRHAGSGVLKKSGNNQNWNVWKGDEEHSEEDDESSNDNSPKWQPPPQQWDNNAWLADPMSILLLKNAVADMHKPTTFLDKITSDPVLFIVAAAIPLSLLLSAVLPVFMNSFAQTGNVPTITTTATGPTKSRSNDLDIMPYLTPVMEAIGTFGIRSISNPDCMQRIFCEVAQEKVDFNELKYVKKAANVAKYLSVGTWLENLGVKDIVDSLSSGRCENIPCGHSTKKENAKSRYSLKKSSDSVKK